jgi:uncharacterized protein (DUF2236 family)
MVRQSRRPHLDAQCVASNKELRLLSHLLNRSARAFLVPPDGMDYDFSRPMGEASLIPPDSVTWRIFKNPISLYIGGVAAVILELAEPSVCAGVWEHSTFRRDPLTRLRRTGFAALVTVYGARSVAEQMIRGVVKAHDRVNGTTAQGGPYRANDPRLLDWVQATASYGFIEAYSRFVSPLHDRDKSQAFREGATAARLYGAVNAPTSLDEWHRQLDATRAMLHPTPVIFEFLELMATIELLPRGLRSVQRLLLRAAVDLVPIELQTDLGLRQWELSGAARWALRTAGRAADRIHLHDSPPAIATRRLGLPSDHLYRTRPGDAAK